MNTDIKTSKWLRWVAAGAFGVMLVFNIMISLEFEKDRVLPSLTLIELGNRAYAQGEGGGGDCQPGGLANQCCPYWNVTVEYGGGWPSFPKITCITGGQLKCKDNC
ncbi:hypothetical protein [Lunatimonas salinarum]|uniref:hypothetical protein n=1 Tax=Lunatimonas salinarum TaxID=1774590 RepID=UPI001AE02DCD|nr:hypothetical protein [Lunatimonas salinarum]